MTAIAIQSTQRGLTVRDFIADIPHDAGAVLVYFILGLILFLIWYGSRPAVIARFAKTETEVEPEASEPRSRPTVGRRIFAGANYPFLAWRRPAYLLSILLLVIGIGGMIYNVFSRGSWVVYGVDFSGGTVIQVNFGGQITADQIRAVNPDWEITRFGDASESEYVIRVPTFEERLDVDPANEVSQALTTDFGENSFEVVRTEAVGPRVGSELQTRALLAILISFALTLVYLAFRFEWRFGVAAIIATGHDVLITLSAIAVLRMEVSIATVAAFLTIVGYSLNDTIVVFDRIREDLGKRWSGGRLRASIDRAINETLPRTVLTGGTSLATLLSLFLFGGDVIRDFTVVLILGIAIGTFSSIFIASPVLAAIEAKWPRSAKKPVRRPSSSRGAEAA